uniref:Structural maintenance of chromosomes protein 6 n=1 Tax=Phallusia mammillata TaxID=59560 RepID=A0A6F9DTC5_9ASCI|nr:structural maintenance of chromosomes protein 6 [Phallusia mammillata]
MATKRKSTDGQSSSSPKKRFLQSTKYQGIIESIFLKNFMCHSRLTLRFTSTVNFVVGHNGSGKSAVLTALIVGLGGKTSSTSRGTSLKTLIKTGSSSATIEITLRNSGDDPVRPDVYGKKIIIERRITSDGQSIYKIKSEAGKVISMKKEDLLTILDELNLHVDNPLTCLNQEMSKNFLHSKNETDKYKFFLKSTQLEQMSRDYRFIKEQRIIIQDVLKRKEQIMPELEKEVLEKEQKFKDLATLQELKHKVNDLKSELAWAHVVQLEHDTKPRKRELDRENLKTPKYDLALEKCLEKEVSAQKKFDELQKKVKEYQHRVKSLEPQKLEAKKAYDQAKANAKVLENALGRTVRQKRETLRDRQELMKRIEELKRNAKTDLEDEKRKREETLAHLQEKNRSLSAQLKNLNHQIEQFSLAVQQGKEDSRRLRLEEVDIQQQQRKVKQIISSLSAGRNDRIKLFGSKMPDFIKKIEDAWNRKKFSKKPRGPIGACLAVKDATLAVPVECSIKGYMHSFVVNNHNDEKLLESLRNSTFSDQERSRIAIYTVSFTNQVYDTSAGKVQHPTFSSVLDNLQIDDPVIANCLIDMAGIESVLVIPNVQDALKTMQHNRPPTNCSKAFTGNGDEVFVDRFYSNQKGAASRYLKVNVDSEIQKNKELLNQLNSKMQKVKHDIAAANDVVKSNGHEQQRHERNKMSIDDKLKKTSVEIRAIKATEDPQPLDVNDLEEEVANYSQQLESLDTVISQQTQQSQTVSTHVEEKKKAWNEVYASIKDIGENAEDLTEKINLASNDLETAKAEKVHFKERKKKHLTSVEAITAVIRAATKNIEDSIKKAKEICPERIATRRTPKNIENEINQIIRRINHEESNHGDHEAIVREYHEVGEKFKEIKRNIRWSKKFLVSIDQYLTDRNAAFCHLRSLIAMRCTLDFDVLLSQRGFKGKMQFNHDDQLLYISVKPHDNTLLTNDLRVLSGGERSFSTVCYVLALWQAIESPLRCLDEFDVFMDMANRRVAMDMMVDMALMQDQKQFIFLTPHDISALPNSKSINVWKMPDPDRGQTRLPFEKTT